MVRAIPLTRVYTRCSNRPRIKCPLTPKDDALRHFIVPGFAAYIATIRSNDPARASELRLRRSAGSNGFTLLELLIVLVIMGLLASLIGPRLLDRIDTSKVTTAETQIRMLRTALDTLRLDIGRYPTSEEGLAILSAAPSDSDLRARWRGPYLEGAMPNDPWGHPFIYSFSGAGNPPFALFSLALMANRGAMELTRMLGSFPRIKIDGWC